MGSRKDLTIKYYAISFKQNNLFSILCLLWLFYMFVVWIEVLVNSKNCSELLPVLEVN